MKPAPSRSRLAWRAVALVYGPAVAILLLTSAGVFLLNRYPSFFVRDPAATLGAHPLIGAQSHLGILVWAAGAGICLSAWTVLRRSGGTRADREPAAFFLYFGVLTTVLLLDDLFLVHEELLGRIGIGELSVLMAYTVAIGAGAIRFRSILFRSADPSVLFAAAFVFFGLSVGVDLVQDLGIEEALNPEAGMLVGEVRLFVEDGLKLLGITSWTAYFAREAWLRLTPRAPPPG